ncbi:phage integrase N-terminal SAM-like domain-containing protein [Alteromonas sp. ASW11-130]|uniref:phage integrase N-terminal SAM-like domain-containing protein n=1 Tax=Alteromonas sp. ASW11-130 TaxID=3015775 RepID=UPI002241D6D9|nr:phage integrase N-terminal SAM-like domain-containing protein [Alteromonas sp. ASW11-130]MCW8091874.1 phage integrase N-terminal SAM-like domain-containing protein [Alteromonas sp. ASW11-130]
MRMKQAKRTVNTYLTWIADYIRFHSYQNPHELGNKDVEAYLTHLSVKRDISITPQSTTTYQ